MKLLIIDNQDSFTYNLVDLVRRLDVPFDVMSVHGLVIEQVAPYTHILLSPGPDVPEAYPQLFQLLNRYYREKSILGVCLGHQTLCQFFGCQLYNLPAPRHGERRLIKARSDSPIFLDLPSSFYVGLYHSWAVTKQDFSTELVVTAYCDQQVVMAMQHRELHIFGVQFHPESYMSEYGEKILKNWLHYKPK